MSLPWSPSPADEPELLNQISVGSVPLGDLASRYSTTVPALCAWINHPDTELKLRAIEQAVARCARLSATNLLPAIVQSAKAMLDEWNEDLANAPVTHPEPGFGGPALRAGRPRIPINLVNLNSRARARDGARRVCNLILRIARFHPTPVPLTFRSGKVSAVPSRISNPPTCPCACTDSEQSQSASRCHDAARDSLASLLTQASALMPQLETIRPTADAQSTHPAALKPPSAPPERGWPDVDPPLPVLDPFLRAAPSPLSTASPHSPLPRSDRRDPSPHPIIRAHPPPQSLCFT